MKSEKPQPSKTIWAFDLGKGSIGEAVRLDDKFPHAESLLIPPELARRGPATVSGTPANRYRAMKTREAHHERERWLETVWKSAGLTPLFPREVWENSNTKKWELKRNGDFQLEREFAPKVGEKTKDGAPSDEAGAEVCYTSCLLRIHLLNGDKLADWQIFKALRAALQCRGYGAVPWATKEARKQGRTAEEVQLEEEKKLQQADARYRDAVGKWPEFKRSVPAQFHFPCYYDASKIGLWDVSNPKNFQLRANHLAASTRNVRFDRVDVRGELIKLGDQAAAILPELRAAFAHWQKDGWKFRHPNGKELTYPVRAKTFGEFLCDGPAGKPDETSFEAFLSQRRDVNVQRGSYEEWMAALGQKTPSFDNRILNNCVLIPRFHVCKVDVRLETKKDENQKDNFTGNIVPESLLASEVTFLLKLKNLLMADGQRKLTAGEIQFVFNYAHRQLKELKLVAPGGELIKNWPGKIADCFALSKSEWGGKKSLSKLALRPLPGHEEVKAPKTSGRSAYSRVALRILKELILSGEAPSVFHAKLLRRDADLLRRLGSSPDKPLALFDDSVNQDEKQRERENNENRKHGILVSELHFLCQMRKDNSVADSWENIFVPSQTLDALQQRHTDDGKLDADAAIRELLGTINDPIVRHRLGVFAARLKKLQHGDEKEEIPKCGVPDAIILEFAREDFMGETAKRELQKFQKEREDERAEAKKMAAEAGAESKLSGLKFQLWKDQGGECLYGKEVFAQNGDSKAQCLYRETALPLSRLDDYVIDHIVPRGEPYNGPDAVINYVLTTSETNEAKGKRTPFEWLHGKPDWDAYVNRVKARATKLRNKKVQLLTREDAPELVERYTALAETAWISKLAQAIVNLHFGWTNGYDKNRIKRVIVVSGGVTARVRRKYGLDKLLYNDTTDAEVLAKKVKNREDKRHHALDAMVMTFIPQWTRDPNKEGFFRFPPEFRDKKGREDYERIRKLFSDHLLEVMPRFLIYERPELADTIYGARTDKAGTVMVQRVKVALLAQQPVGQQKTKFDLDYLGVQIKAVRDAKIQQRLTEEYAKLPDEAQWNKFCAEFRQARKDGSLGARILFVTQNLDKKPIEFKDLSKDKRGAFRTTDQKHRGQFVYLDQAGNPHVEPVRVFDSVCAIEALLRARPDFREMVGFFESYCLVELQRVVTHKAIELPAGKYKLNTMKKDGRAQLTSASGIKSPEVLLKKLLPAGFRRID